MVKLFIIIIGILILLSIYAIRIGSFFVLFKNIHSFFKSQSFREFFKIAVIPFALVGCLFFFINRFEWDLRLWVEVVILIVRLICFGAAFIYFAAYLFSQDKKKENVVRYGEIGITVLTIYLSIFFFSNFFSTF